MKAFFICLANSKKHGGRCVAGITVKDKVDNIHEIIYNELEPAWIRPITQLEYGQVPNELVKDLQLLDVVEIEVTEIVPDGYQSENVLFEPNSFKIVSRIGLVPENLDLLTDINLEYIFNSSNSALSATEISTCNKSLIFIKVSDVILYTKEGYYGSIQLRARFTFNEKQYDLPITDLSFKFRYLSNYKILDNINHIYFTVSIGLPLNESWYYKLIAGVIISP